MKKFYLWFYYGVVSLIFTLQSIIYINDSGDQTSFAQMAKQYGFLEFARYRYKTWSSRLLIESLTMFMSSHYLIFDIVMFVSVACFFYCFNGVFLKEPAYWKLRFLTPILFLFLFPSIFFTSAGLIATVTNYLFPMIAFMVAWYCLEKKRLVWFIVAIVLFLFACMQEQFTIFTFLLFAFLLLKKRVQHKKVDYHYLTVLMIATVGIVSALLAPGSANRSAVETQTWYPGFDKLSLGVKMTKGYLETNHVLFVQSDLSLIYLLVLFILVLALVKKRYFSVVLSAGMGYVLTSHLLGISGIFTAIQRTVDFQTQNPDLPFSFKVNLYPLVVYTILLLVVSLVIIDIFREKLQMITPLVILAIGYVARMTVSLSPTIYASGLRTFTPLIFAGLIVLALISRECFVSLQKKTVKLAPSLTE